MGPAQHPAPGPPATVRTHLTPGLPLSLTARFAAALPDGVRGDAAGGNKAAKAGAPSAPPRSVTSAPARGRTCPSSSKPPARSFRSRALTSAAAHQYRRRGPRAGGPIRQKGDLLSRSTRVPIGERRAAAPQIGARSSLAGGCPTAADTQPGPADRSSYPRARLMRISLRSMHRPRWLSPIMRPWTRRASRLPAGALRQRRRTRRSGYRLSRHPHAGEPDHAGNDHTARSDRRRIQRAATRSRRCARSAEAGRSRRHGGAAGRRQLRVGTRFLSTCGRRRVRRRQGQGALRQS